MRGLSLLLLGAMVGSCTTAPPAPMRSARGESRFQELVAGKVAGPPQSCMPTISYYSNDNMVVIDGQTVVFRGTGGRVYVNHLSPGCENVGVGNTLVTKQAAASGLCRGDIAQVQNLTAHITVGSCALGDFIPYSPPGA